MEKEIKPQISHRRSFFSKSGQPPRQSAPASQLEEYSRINLLSVSDRETVSDNHRLTERFYAIKNHMRETLDALVSTKTNGTTQLQNRILWIEYLAKSYL